MGEGTNPVPVEVEVRSTSVDLWKYMSRSFLLPLVGMVGVLYLAQKHPDLWDKLWIPGLLCAAFAGIFNLNEAFKSWAELKYGRGVPIQQTHQ